jgi:diguanylate cyclase (GGDEF)-like protein
MTDAPRPAPAWPDFGEPALVPLEPPIVMMVDDEPLMTELIQTHLEDAGYAHFVACNEPLEALKLMQRRRPGLVLLDLMMPELDGFAILAAMRADEALRYTPVIVLTAAADARTKLRALELGATEFLAKPVDPSELVLRVRNTLAFKLYQDRLATIDPVTGLSNRHTFSQYLEGVLVRAGARRAMVGLLHIDCDFKQAREALGPSAADAIARCIARRLNAALGHLGESAVGAAALDHSGVARLGEQEFAVLLRPLEHADGAASLAKDLLHRLAEPIDVDGHQIVIAPAVGIALYPTDGQQVHSLQKSADLAAAKARRQGKGSLAFFSAELDARSMERLTLTQQLRRGLERGEFRLHYQPKLDLHTGAVIGAEALIRWQHPERGLLYPGTFIGLAEESGLIVELGDWVVAEACAQSARWRQGGLGDMKIAVNVSKLQFDGGHVLAVLREQVARHGLQPGQLVVEITESLLVSDADAALDLLAQIQALGVHLSIDDFGTGYSSLSYLKRFPVDELKIDRSFIVDIPARPEDLAIVRTVVALGHSLGMTVVAEGVEQPTQLAALRDAGCDHYQGFLFSPAVPPDEFADLARATAARIAAGG